MEKDNKNNLISELRHVFLLILPSVILGIRIAMVEKPKGTLLVIFLIVIFFLTLVYAKELIRIYNKYKNKNI